MACEVAASASTGQLVLFHHDPAYTDDMIAGMERKAKSLFTDSVAAREGLELNLTPRFDYANAPLSAKEREVKYAQNG
jgi:ribonuclease BN (tRNA processing enzyme)